MPSRVNKRGVLALSSVERFNGLAQIALSDVFACAKPSQLGKKRKIVYEQSNRSLKPFVARRGNVRVAVHSGELFPIPIKSAKRVPPQKAESP